MRPTLDGDDVRDGATVVLLQEDTIISRVSFLCRHRHNDNTL